MSTGKEKDETRYCLIDFRDGYFVIALCAFEETQTGTETQVDVLFLFYDLSSERL